MATSETTSELNTRERLLAAAFEVFAEKGYAGTRVQEIAARAGFTTGAIYANFAGKAALLGEALGSNGLGALQSVTRPLGEGGRPADVLTALGMRSLTGERSTRDVVLLDALAAAARDPEVAALVMPRITAWTDGLREVIERSADEGGIDPRFSTDALVTLATAVGLGSFVLRALDAPRPAVGELEEVWSRLIASYAPPREA
ncbi:MAG TPA: helix-turn-helix domain-containing protein [Acidimicrobiales bacterium]|nr:helix-turn-helix domain-containing protein [Acidimicrobiales bacterium]